MATTQFKIKGINRIKLLLKSGNAKRRIDKRAGKATGQNGLILLAAIRKGIQSDNYAANAALTEAIKGSSKPLVDKGDLFQAIAIHQPTPLAAFVGVLRTDEAFNIGSILHEGVTIRVTERMRGLFFILWLASQGSVSSGELTGRARDLFQRYKNWKPLDENTTEIRIPARRFIGDVFDNRALKRRLVINWKNAVRLGMLDASKKK